MLGARARGRTLYGKISPPMRTSWQVEALFCRMFMAKELGSAESIYYGPSGVDELYAWKNTDEGERELRRQTHLERWGTHGEDEDIPLGMPRERRAFVVLARAWQRCHSEKYFLCDSFKSLEHAEEHLLPRSKTPMAQTSMKTDDLIIARGTEIDLEKIDLVTLKEAASGVEEVRFSYDGGHYVIDLNAANREKFADVLKPFINAAGTVSAERSAARRTVRGSETAREDSRAARAWAQGAGKKIVTEAGVKVPGDRGRVDSRIVVLWEQAGKPSA